jgi:hypothetical protein
MICNSMGNKSVSTGGKKGNKGWRINEETTFINARFQGLRCVGAVYLETLSLERGQDHGYCSFRNFFP